MGSGAERHKAAGYEVECTYSGQRRRYGDSYSEYEVVSDNPETEVRAYCIEHIRKCNLTSSKYYSELRAGLDDFGNHFRSHYKFEKLIDGKYFYKVTHPSTH